MSRIWKADQLTMTAPWRPTLVKNSDVAPTEIVSVDTESLVSSLLEEARRQAEQVVLSAESQAAEILEEAERLVERRQQEGFDAGRQAGLAAGEKAGKAKYQQQLEALQQERERLVEKDSALLAESEQEIVEMALMIASQAIGQKLRSDDQVVQSSLQQVMSAAMGARSALLLVSPDDFDHLWAKRQEWAASVPGLREFSLEQSPSLQKGDLLLQSNLGTIDARVETILEQVADQLGDGVAH